MSAYRAYGPQFNPDARGPGPLLGDFATKREAENAAYADARVGWGFTTGAVSPKEPAQDGPSIAERANWMADRMEDEPSSWVYRYEAARLLRWQRWRIEKLEAALAEAKR